MISKTLTSHQIEEILRCYEFTSNVELAERFGVKPHNVFRVGKHYGLGKKIFNFDFFETPNIDNSHIAGFISADGSMNCRMINGNENWCTSIRITEGDKGYLEDMDRKWDKFLYHMEGRCKNGIHV